MLHPLAIISTARVYDDYSVFCSCEYNSFIFHPNENGNICCCCCCCFVSGLFCLASVFFKCIHVVTNESVSCESLYSTPPCIRATNTLTAWLGLSSHRGCREQCCGKHGGSDSSLAHSVGIFGVNIWMLGCWIIWCFCLVFWGSFI